MASIPSTIPDRLGHIAAGSFQLSGQRYDVAIGGIPFLMANGRDDSNSRKTAQFKRQQFDNAPEAGEQTLSQWWLRSQASFHGGAGQLYFEPAGGQDEFSRIRFQSSKNVDVWTAGKVTRLPDTTSIFSTASAIAAMVTATKAGVDYCLIAVGTTLTAWKSSTGTTSTYTWGGSDGIVSLCTDGSNYYAATPTGIYKGPVDGGSNGALLWNTGNSAVVIGWVKQRLMAGIANKIYELSGGSPPTLPTAKYTHPNTSWSFTAFAEGPKSILAAGSAGSNSAILEFVLDSQGVTPTLTGGTTALDMPTGEQVLCMQHYMGSFLSIGTNSGVWVASFDPFSGSLQLGPKMVVTGAAVRSITGRDRFLYITASGFIDGESGLVRIDLGTVIDKAGHLAYASDLICPSVQTAAAATVAVLPTSQSLVFGLSTVGVFKEGVGAGSGRAAWIKTSRIRYTTIEPKLFKLCRVRGNFTGGTLSIFAETSQSGEIQVVSSLAVGKDPQEFALTVPPDEWASLRIELDGSAVAELRSYQIKAWPAVKRSRTIKLVLSCFDFEKDMNGVDTGRSGWALDRLSRLELVENNGDETLLERFTTLGTFSDRVTIDEIDFVEVDRPKNDSAAGGFVLLTMTTVV